MDSTLYSNACLGGLSAGTMICQFPFLGESREDLALPPRSPEWPAGRERGASNNSKECE